MTEDTKNDIVPKWGIKLRSSRADASTIKLSHWPTRQGTVYHYKISLYTLYHQVITGWLQNDQGHNLMLQLDTNSLTLLERIDQQFDFLIPRKIPIKIFGLTVSFSVHE